MLCIRLRYYIVLLFTLISTLVSGQVEEQTHIEELLLEQLSEDLEGNDDVSDILERLNFYRKHPLNLNNATESDLLNLVILSPQLVDNLLYHRKVAGDFVSILELQGVPGFSPQLIQLLQYFVIVDSAKSLKNITLKDILDLDEHSLMLRYGRVLESQKGYHIDDPSKSRYLGDPNRYAVRYRWNYQQKIKVAINMKKDAGEPFFTERQKLGFDFYSGHIEFNNLSKHVKKVVVGDYSLQFGQGLVIWNGMSYGKGAWIGSVARQGVGLKGYSSLNENNFQRGIATKLEFGSFEWTPFVAYNSLSGKVLRSDSTDLISTISMSGLHRTPTEMSYRNEVKQFVYGSNWTYRYKRWKVGLTYLGSQFNGVKVRGDELRNKYDFEGQELHQLALSYQTTIRNYYIFGETAHSFHSGFATINGVIASLNPKFSTFLTYRNYAKNYHSFFGQALGEGSSVSNENGFYGGVIYHPNRKIEWMNYLDVFNFPWLKYRVDASSYGTDYLSQFTYSWYKRGKVTFRYRYRLKQENIRLENYSKNRVTDVSKHQMRIDFQYKWNDTWSTRTRAELAFFDKGFTVLSKGILVYQDVFWKGISKLSLNTRLAYFNTNDYNSRIYAYENDVLYASSFPVYYDKGWRSYLNARWRVSKAIDLWARYSISYYPDREVVGSGLDESFGKIRSDVKVQLRWEW